MDVVVYSAQANPTEEDRRYRILVSLTRNNRKSAYTVHCMQCTYRLGELVNTEISAIQDLVDMSPPRGMVGLRCGGRFQGGRCGVYYYFTMSESNA